MSASDSTFSKNVFKETTYAGHVAMGDGKEKLACTPPAVIPEGGGSSNPFGSKGSIIEAHEKATCTHTPQSLPPAPQTAPAKVDATIVEKNRVEEVAPASPDVQFLEERGPPAAPVDNDLFVLKNRGKQPAPPTADAVVDIVDDFVLNYKKTRTPVSDLDKELMELDAKGADFDRPKPQVSPTRSMSSVPVNMEEVRHSAILKTKQIFEFLSTPSTLMSPLLRSSLHRRAYCDMLFHLLDAGYGCRMSV